MCDELELEDDTEEQKTNDRDNLVMDSVDPLLNVEPLTTECVHRSNKCDLDDNNDCDISLIKNRLNIWDTLSIASRRSDGETENNTDFTDFNLLSYTFDATDMGTLESSTGDSSQNVVFELESDVSFAALQPSEMKKSRSLLNNKIIKSTEPDGDPILTSSKVDKNMNVGKEYNDEQNISIFDQELIAESDREHKGADYKTVNVRMISSQLRRHSNAEKNQKFHRIVEIGNITGV